MNGLVIKWVTIAEKWGRISGMLGGGSVNLTLNMYALKSLLKLCWPMLFVTFIYASESIDVVFSFLVILYSITFEF